MTDAAVVQEDSEEAFSAGFDGPAEQSAAPEAPAEAATSEAPAAEPAAAPAAPVLIAGLTQEQWNAEVAKAAQPHIEAIQAEVRKNFGQIGDVTRTIKEIKDRLAAGGTPAARKKLTAEALKRVDEELPGLAAALAGDLAEYLDSPAVVAEAAAAQTAAEAKGETFDKDAFLAENLAPALAQAEARINERAELRIVKSLHRDFDTVVKSPEFSGWLGTLPADRQKAIRESDDGFVAADAVTDFKAAQAKATADKAKKQDRLDRATTPSGDRRPASHVPQDEEAAFSAGFASVK